MSNNKPKGSKRNKASDDLLDAATDGLKKFRRFAKQVQKLSTAQKIVGGLAVLAAGYAFFTNSSPDDAPAAVPALDEPALLPEAPLTANASAPAQPLNPKRTKSGSHAKHVPFSEEHS